MTIWGNKVKTSMHSEIQKNLIKKKWKEIRELLVWYTIPKTVVSKFNQMSLKTIKNGKTRFFKIWTYLTQKINPNWAISNLTIFLTFPTSF